MGLRTTQTRFGCVPPANGAGFPRPVRVSPSFSQPSFTVTFRRYIVATSVPISQPKPAETPKYLINETLRDAQNSSARVSPFPVMTDQSTFLNFASKS